VFSWPIVCLLMLCFMRNAHLYLLLRKAKAEPGDETRIVDAEGNLVNDFRCGAAPKWNGANKSKQERKKCEQKWQVIMQLMALQIRLAEEGGLRLYGRNIELVYEASL
jgi:hypothetical protein